MLEKSVLFCCFFNNLDRVILEPLSFIGFMLCLVLALVVFGNMVLLALLPEYRIIFVVVCVHLELGKTEVIADVFVLRVLEPVLNMLPRVLCGVFGVSVVNMDVFKLSLVFVLEGVGSMAVIEVARSAVSVGMVISVVDPVELLLGVERTALVWVLGNLVVRVEKGLLSLVEVEACSVVEADED